MVTSGARKRIQNAPHRRAIPPWGPRGNRLGKEGRPSNLGIGSNGNRTRWVGLFPQGSATWVQAGDQGCAVPGAGWGARQQKETRPREGRQQEDGPPRPAHCSSFSRGKEVAQKGNSTYSPCLPWRGLLSWGFPVWVTAQTLTSPLSSPGPVGHAGRERKDLLPGDQSRGGSQNFGLQACPRAFQGHLPPPA